QAKARAKQNKRLTPEEQTRKFQEIFGMRPKTPSTDATEPTDPITPWSVSAVPASSPMPNEKCPMPNAQSFPGPTPLTNQAAHLPEAFNNNPTAPRAESPSAQPDSINPLIQPSAPEPEQHADGGAAQAAIEDHTRRRASSYIPQPAGQPPIVRDETWKE